MPSAWPRLLTAPLLIRPDYALLASQDILSSPELALPSQSLILIAQLGQPLAALLVPMATTSTVDYSAFQEIHTVPPTIKILEVA